jgi:hypothetical protein
MVISGAILADNPGDRYLYIGLIPNFGAFTSKIPLGDFSIEEIYAGKITNCFPDINLSKVLKYDGSKRNYFIVFGTLEKAPDEQFEIGKIIEKDGKRLISIGAFFAPGDLDRFKKPILFINLFKNNSPPVFVLLGLSRWISEENTYQTQTIPANIVVEKHLSTTDEGDLYFRRNCHIKKEELEDFINFKKNVYPVLDNEDPKYLKIATDYFFQGCLKEVSGNDEMATLDFVIALDALFLENEPELKYKFANRVAILLGNSDAIRAEFQKYADEIYWVRNKIVHGDYTREDIEENLLGKNGKGMNDRYIGEKKYSVKEVTRLSIVYFLSLLLNGMQKKDITKKLDSALFNNNDRQAITLMKTRLKVGL